MSIQLENIDQIGKILNDSINRIKQDSFIFYAQQLLSQTKSRIFGDGATDTEGKKLPKYNKKYKELKGKTSNTWNLIDTTSLMKSYDKAIFEGKINIGFTSEKEAQIAEDLEKRADTIIFTPNEKEISFANRTTIKFIISKFEEDFNNILK